MKLYVVVFRFVPLLMDFQGAIAWFLGNHTRLNAKGDYCLKFVPLPSIGEELKSQPLFDSSAENALLFLLMPMNVEKLYISKKVIFKAFCWREKVANVEFITFVEFQIYSGVRNKGKIYFILNFGSINCFKKGMELLSCLKSKPHLSWTVFVKKNPTYIKTHLWYKKPLIIVS